LSYTNRRHMKHIDAACSFWSNSPGKRQHCGLGVSSRSQYVRDEFIVSGIWADLLQ
jgi:hypothetical protein